MSELFYPLWALFAAIVALYIGFNGYKKKSLSKSGAISAIIVGFVTFSLNAILGIVLTAFFISSSKLTKYGAERKKKIEVNHQDGGQRTVIQVISNSFSATILLLMVVAVGYWANRKGTDSSFLTALLAALPSPALIPFQPSLLPSNPINLFISACITGAIAHYAACCGDTWSSEIGSLAKQKPILITTFSSVPTGTNGGCSLNGLIAGILGGGFIGVVAAIVVCVEYCLFYFESGNVFSHIFSSLRVNKTDLISSPSALTFDTSILIAIVSKLIVIGFVTGFIGTILDSLIGATLQCSVWDQDIQKVIEIESWKEYDEKVGRKGNNSQKGRYSHICGYPLLDNHQVNLVSSAIVGFGTFIFTLLT